MHTQRTKQRFAPTARRGLAQQGFARHSFERRGFARRGFAQRAALGVIVVCMAACVVLTILIGSSAGRHKLTYSETAERGMMSFESLNVAMGPFRGILINALWMRANDLQQAGRLFEANELARAILRLQPRMPRVWVFHAWNLAYNVSVQTNTPTERWSWVNKGVEILRAEGLRANPGDLLLHRELAWIFLHKIQGVTDDVNQYYKKYMAEEWTSVLGPPPPRLEQTRTREQAVEAYAQWLTKVYEAPSTRAELAARSPRAAALADEIRTRAGLDLETRSGRFEFLRSATRFQARREWTRSKGVRDLLGSLGPQGQGAGVLANPPGAGASVSGAELSRRLVETVGQLAPGEATLLSILYPSATSGQQDAEIDAARELLVLHARRRAVEVDYNMDIGRMIAHTKIYGPLDWRHPASHAIYWSAKGSEEGLKRIGTVNERDFDFINNDRNIVQSVQELFRFGTIVYDPIMPDLFVTMPNPDWIATYGKVLLELAEREKRQYMVKHNADISGKIWNFYAAGYENFTLDAIAFLYRRGQIDEARRMQIDLAAWSGLNTNDPLRTEAIRGPLEDLIVEQIKDRINSPSIALPEIAGALQGAFFDGLMVGNLELFRAQYNYAKRFHAEFVKEQDLNSMATDVRMRTEAFDRDFHVLAGQQLAFILTSLAASGGDPLAPGAGLGQAMVLYRRAGEDGRLQASARYFLDRLRPRDAQGKTVDRSFDAAFPEPPEFSAFKSIMDQRARQLEESNRAKTTPK
jgi:hypothetical protein